MGNRDTSAHRRASDSLRSCAHHCRGPGHRLVTASSRDDRTRCRDASGRIAVRHDGVPFGGEAGGRCRFSGIGRRRGRGPDQDQWRLGAEHLRADHRVFGSPDRRVVVAVRGRRGRGVPGAGRGRAARCSVRCWCAGRGRGRGLRCRTWPAGRTWRCTTWTRTRSRTWWPCSGRARRGRTASRWFAQVFSPAGGGGGELGCTPVVRSAGVVARVADRHADPSDLRQCGA